MLDYAKQHEEQRRLKSAEEINLLRDLVNDAVRKAIVGNKFTFQEIQAKALTILDSDIKNLKILMQSLKQNQDEHSASISSNTEHCIHYALSTNKLEIIFQNAKEFIEKNFSSDGLKFAIDAEARTDLSQNFDWKEDNIYSFGTSALNFAQVAAITILRVLHDNQHVKLQDLFVNQDEPYSSIYNVNTSPVLQTTKLPSGYDLEEKLPGFAKEFFYIYKDVKSPEPGELLIPNLGYAFGGSRADTRYQDKEFRTMIVLQEYNFS